MTGGVGYPNEYRNAALLRRALALDEAEIGELLAVAVADTLIAGSAFTELLGQLLKVDLRDTWTPDQTFVDRVSDKAALQAIAAEVGVAPPAKTTGKELRAAIWRRLDGQSGPTPSDWLPSYLRFPFEGYAPERSVPEGRAGYDKLAAILEGSDTFEEPYANVGFGSDPDETGEGVGDDFGIGAADDDFGLNAEDISQFARTNLAQPDPRGRLANFCSIPNEPINSSRNCNLSMLPEELSTEIVDNSSGADPSDVF